MDYLEGPFSTSVDLRLDNSELSGSNHRGRIVQLEEFSASLDDTYEEKSSETHVLVSGSSQVNADNVTNFDANVKDKLNTETVISGSLQITSLPSVDTDDLAEGSTNLYYTDARVKAKLNTETVISGSIQVNADNVTNFDSNVKDKLNVEDVISGSLQITSLPSVDTDDLAEGSTNLYYTDTRVKTKLNAETVISGSSQVNANNVTNFDANVKDKLNVEDVISGSLQITSLPSVDTDDLAEGSTNLYYTDTRVKTKLNAETVISGSTQIDIDHLDTDDLSEGSTNLYYTDARVKTKLNTETVVSGSSQVPMGGDISGNANDATVIKVQGVALTSGEATQISNIGSETISSTQWGYLGASNQGIATTNDVTFNTGSFTGNVSVTGNLTVLGSATEILTSELRITDKLITVASGSIDSAAADGAGIEIDGADVSIQWDHNTTSFVLDAKVSSSVGFKGEGGELTGIDTDQVTEATNLYYTDTRVKTKLNTETVISGSTQINLGHLDTDDLTEGSTNLYYTDTRVKTKLNTEDVVSGSAQVVNHLPSGTVSGSIQVVLNDADKTGFDTDDVPEGTSIYFTNARVKTKLNTEGVISGSSQVDADSITNFDSNVEDKLNAEVVHSGSYLGTSTTSNLSEGTNLYYTNTRVKTKLNTESVLSGSTQVNLGHLTTDDLTEGSTNLYYTDVRVKTKLNTETVVSGSSQLHTDLDLRYLEINGDGVVSGSSQILHDSTNGFVANEHIDHSSITIGSGKGLTGGGSIETSRSLTLDTGSAHFDEGIKKIIDADGVISGSSQLHTDLDSRYLEINGDGVISGSSQVNADSITNFDSNVKTKLDAEAVVSGSSFVSNHQGSITASINSVSTNVDLGLNIDDSPTFSSLTLSNTTTGTSSDLDALFDVSGVTKKRTLGTSAFFNVSSSIDDDPNSIPTTKAVSDALIAAGAGDITSVNSSNLYPASSTGIAHSGNGTQDGSSYYGNIGNVVLVIDTGSAHFQEGVELYLDGTYSNTDNTNHLNSLGVISGSEQLENTFLEINGDGVISGSSQITITESQISDLSHYTDANVKTKLDTEGVISGSSQITITESQISDLSHYTDTNVKTKLDTEGVISGSSQITKTLQDVTDDGASTSTAIHITNTTTSAARNTGALVVDGGLGVGGSITANLVQVYSATPKMMVSNSDSTIVDGQTVGSYQFRHTDNDGGGSGGIFSIDLVATADFEGLNSTPAEYQFDTAIRVDGLVTASAFYGDGSNLTGVTSYTDSDNTDHLNSLGVVSGSGQIQTLFVGTAVSTSLDDRLDTLEGESHENPLTFTDTDTIDFTRSTDTITANIIGGVVSGSSQVSLGGDVTGTANDVNVGSVQGVALTSGEVTQISNIGVTTISATQWGYLGGSDQNVKTTSDVTFASASLNNVVISGNLTVLGDAVQLGVSELTIEDKTITVASGSADSAAANGAGILIAGADESITWNHGNSRFDISDDIHVTGTIQATNDIIAYASSDIRLKNNIKPIENPLDKIHSISGNSFDWNVDKQDIYNGKDYGVIAQEIENILPELVITKEDGYKAVKYDKLVSLLVEGIKELSNEVNELKTKIDNQSEN